MKEPRSDPEKYPTALKQYFIPLQTEKGKSPVWNDLQVPTDFPCKKVDRLTELWRAFCTCIFQSANFRPSIFFQGRASFMPTTFGNRRVRNHRRGFSLVELLIVMAILGILAAISVPNFVRARESAKYGWFHASARSIGASLEVYAAANKNRYPIDGINYGPPGQNATKWRQDSGMEWLGTTNPNQEPTWKVDYELHNNTCPGGSPGTSYIALVFQGVRNSSPATSISGNCTFRTNYKFGEAIPNEDGRLFVLKESVLPENVCPDSNCN